MCAEQVFSIRSDIVTAMLVQVGLAMNEESGNFHAIHFLNMEKIDFLIIERVLRHPQKRRKNNMFQLVGEYFDKY